ncbi:hypothetical protein [Aurantivibrio plasticivorans]
MSSPLEELAKRAIEDYPSEIVTLIGSVAVLLFFTGKVFDLIEKWYRIKGLNPSASNFVGNSFTEDNVLPVKSLIFYCFLGAMLLPVLRVLAFAVFLVERAFLIGQIESLFLHGLFAIVGVSITMLFVRHKFTLVNHNRVVAVLVASAVTGVISMPIYTFMTIVQLNKFAA